MFIHTYKMYCMWFDVFLFTAYESLQSREETRNSAWLKEGWNVNVYFTGSMRHFTHVNSPN